MLPISEATLPFAVLVVAMLVVEVFLLTQIVPRRGPRPSLARMIIGSSALMGSAGTLMALVDTTATATLDSYAVLLFAFNFMMVAPPGIWIVAVIVFRDRTIDAESWFWPLAIVAMATSAEVLMGLLFVVVDGGPLGLTTVVAGTLVSAWYLWSMVGATVALTIWLPLPWTVRAPLLGLSASGFVAPWVATDPIVGALLVSVVMGGTIALLFRLARTPAFAGSRLLVGVFGAFVAMALAGFAVAASNGSEVAILGFGVVMTGVMVGEFAYLVREGLHPRSDRTAIDPSGPLPTVEPAAEVSSPAVRPRES
ncbi:MAG TPA: hypothetical protein VIZ68_03705 [Thermoplasmata archaeon]